MHIGVGRLPFLGALSVGALIVHELRYRLAFGSGAEHALAEQGHRYLQFVGPAFGLLMALVLAVGIARWAGAVRRAGVAPTRGKLWLAFSVGLVAVYTAQEWTEGAFVAGHPSGLAGVFGHGGWLAVLLSLAVGWLLTLVVRIAAGAARMRPGAGRCLCHVGAACMPGMVGLRAPLARVRSPLARRQAGRAPPEVRVSLP